MTAMIERCRICEMEHDLSKQCPRPEWQHATDCGLFYGRGVCTCGWEDNP